MPGALPGNPGKRVTGRVSREGDVTGEENFSVPLMEWHCNTCRVQLVYHKKIFYNFRVLNEILKKLNNIVPIR